jgi:hypothetical protein
MTMKINRLIYLLLLLLPLCSCERDDDLPYEAGYTTVSFQVPSLSVSTDTRATTALVEGTKVTVYAYEITDGNESDEYTQSKEYTANASGILVPDDGQPMALFSTQTYKFYAVSPVHSFIDGSQKQFELENSYTADFKVSSIESTLSASTATLTFDAFRLEYSAIRLTLQRDTDALSVTSIVPDASKSGVSFTALAHTPYTYTLGDDGIDASASEVDGELTIPVAAITEVTADNLYTSLGYVLPKKSASFRITAYITANGSTASTFSAEIPAMAFLPGKKYLFTVLFTDPMVYFTLKVTDWNDVTTTSDVGGEEGLGVTLGNWSTDGWDSGKIGTDTEKTILVGSWAVSPDAWSTGDIGGGTNNTLHIGDWNGTSWGSGNVGTDQLSTLTNGGEWNTSSSWNATNTGAGNGNNTLGGNSWSTGTWSSGNVGTDQHNTLTNSGNWNTSSSWNATNTGAGNGNNTLGCSDWSVGIWGSGNVGTTDHSNSLTGSGSWSTGGSWNMTNTGAGNGNNTLGSNSWGTGIWSSGNVGTTDHSNSLTGSGSWSTGGSWNMTNTGAGNGNNTLGSNSWGTGIWSSGNVGTTDHSNSLTGSGWTVSTLWNTTNTGAGNGNNTLGCSDWGIGTWGSGNVGTDTPGSVTTTPWSSNTNDMGNMGEE